MYLKQNRNYCSVSTFGVRKNFRQKVNFLSHDIKGDQEDRFIVFENSEGKFIV